MGREVRRVPANWQHPKKPHWDGRTGRYEDRYQPMFDKPFAPAMHEWYAEWCAWERGEKPAGAISETYIEYNGGPPDPDYYRPDWADAERTHLMMYEDTSEGTPISPAFETPEELARWLADNGASSFGSSTATYEQWLPICKGGWAPSMVISGGRMMSGVEACSALNGAPKHG
jgi:hypothetical protein